MDNDKKKLMIIVSQFSRKNLAQFSALLYLRPAFIIYQFSIKILPYYP